MIGALVVRPVRLTSPVHGVRQPASSRLPLSNQTDNTNTHMLIKPKQLLTALVVAGITALAASANAATFVAGDLLLGFRATGGQGSTSTYVVNLGSSYGTYRDATSNIASVIDIGSALTTIYGANWNTRSDLFWGIAGVRSNAASGASVGGDPVKTNYVSAAQTTINPGVSGNSNPWVVSGSTARATIANNINDVQVSFAAAAGYGGANGNNTAEIATSVANTWEDKNTGTDSFALGSSIEGNFGSGAAGTALDLYRILNTNTGASPAGTVGTGSWEGTFTISNSGVVGFSVTAAAVPEPSRALLGGLGLFGVFFRRRRKQALVKKA